MNRYVNGLVPSPPFRTPTLALALLFFVVANAYGAYQPTNKFTLANKNVLATNSVVGINRTRITGDFGAGMKVEYN